MPDTLPTDLRAALDTWRQIYNMPPPDTKATQDALCAASDRLIREAESLDPPRLDLAGRIDAYKQARLAVARFDEFERRRACGAVDKIEELAAAKYGAAAPAGPVEAPPSPADSPAPAKTRGGKLAAALALKIQHPGWTAERIAGEVGCAPSYLSRQPRWQAACEAARASGRDGKAKAGRDRGRDMDQYADKLAAAQPRPRSAKCAACDDAAGTDAEGRPLTHGGKPYCQECWAELTGR
jgi:hypothetical protein